MHAKAKLIIKSGRYSRLIVRVTSEKRRDANACTGKTDHTSGPYTTDNTSNKRVIQRLIITSRPYTH